jgi:hypothetical protein
VYQSLLTAPVDDAGRRNRCTQELRRGRIAVAGVRAFVSAACHQRAGRVLGGAGRLA